MKKILSLLFIMNFLFLCSCSSQEKDSIDIKEDFMNYYENQLDDQIFTTSMDTKLEIWDIGKENTLYSPKVVLSLSMKNLDDAAMYQWLQLSINKRKADLEECGDLVVDYAKDQNWKNDYDLYICLHDLYDHATIVYDYEQNEIWIPNCESIFIEMYEKFNTFSKKDLEETQEGIDFLIENDLGYMKHNQVEYNYDATDSYMAFILKGEFSETDKEESTKY